jgi:4-hydroxy-tetrahydrodipicolinate synthase
MKALGRLFTAMITPFDEHDAVNVDEAVRLAEFLVARGNDGLIVSGTTGESPALETDEKLALFGAIKDALGAGATVIAGTTGNNTRHSVELTKEAEKVGVDGILAVVPYYSKPPQDGLLLHFGAIADATTLPVILYNIPGRTNINMLPETVHELARRHENIVAIKESSGNVEQFTALVRDRVREDFTVLSGDDYFYLPALALGAYGCISVAAHVCSRELRAMADAYVAGDVEGAARIHRDLQELFTQLFVHPSPIPVKWAMNEFGFSAGQCRPPLGPMPEKLKTVLRPLIAPFRPE